MIKMRKAYVEDIVILAETAADDSIEECRNLRQWSKRNIDCGPAYTAVYKDRVVAVFGVVLVRPGLGEIWMVVSGRIDKSYSFMKEGLIAIWNMIDVIAETFEIKKIRARSRIGFDKSQRLLEHAGFIRQRRTFGDHYLYIRKF